MINVSILIYQNLLLLFLLQEVVPTLYYFYFYFILFSFTVLYLLTYLRKYIAAYNRPNMNNVPLL